MFFIHKSVLIYINPVIVIYIFLYYIIAIFFNINILYKYLLKQLLFLKKEITILEFST